MCGIVGFFGTINNNIPSILTGMGSIIYRAPDSTGIGWFGDETEPIRVRRSLGPVTGLIRELFPHASESRFSRGTPSFLFTRDREAQRKLLKWEGFPPDGTACSSNECVEPGFVGSYLANYQCTITNREDLRAVFRRLSTSFNLSPVVTKELIKRELERQLDRSHKEAQDRSELFIEFDRLCGELTEESESPPNPMAETMLWAYLSGISIFVPAEYDQDPVRAAFRLIDGSLTARLPFRPELREEVQLFFARLWPGPPTETPAGPPENPGGPPADPRENPGGDPTDPPDTPGGGMDHSDGPKNVPDWFNTYNVEKELNVFGWAGAAAIAFLKQKEWGEAGGSGNFANRGSTIVDARTRAFFSQPILAHGRWAIQSPVTEENAHPFFDDKKTRVIVLNGQFNAGVEAELRQFLRLCGLRFRSGNSSEFVALLWGYYFDLFHQEQQRAKAVQAHVDAGLEQYTVGSQNIDYRIYSRLKGKSIQELDELAFIEAARNIVKAGGQVAVAGISLVSPRCIYIAEHNRPVFLARNPREDAVMVVSDIKAALGLFSQKLITSKMDELARLDAEYESESASLTRNGAERELIRDYRCGFQRKREAVLDCFRISVIPLEGKELFAKIENAAADDETRRVQKRITIRNFEGEPFTDSEEFEMVLDPSEGKQETYRSFFESHLREIPRRLSDMLRLYLPEDGHVPQFRVKTRYFRRRFGSDLSALRRILLAGMGSSYNIGLSAKGLLESVFPRKEIVVLKPSKIGHLKKSIDPEGDLVLLLSWSGTTAEIIEFANELLRHNIALVGVTNKPFSDLGLLAWKSGGIIHIYSGEEITSSAVKSSLSMLFTVGLFSILLLTLMNKTKWADRFVKNFFALPEEIQSLLDVWTETDILKVVQNPPRDFTSFFLIDTLFSNGTGPEVALKLEENSGRLVGKPLDYRDVASINWMQYMDDTLIIVNATCKARIDETLTSMKTLFLYGVPFIAVTYYHPFTEAVRYFSKDRMVILKKVTDPLQPFISLSFFYLFTYVYSKHEGFTIPGFPRNRAKSVTTSRSRSVVFSSFGSELNAISSFLRRYGPAGLEKSDGASAEGAGSIAGGETVWEKEAGGDWERERYFRLRKLLEDLAAPDLWDRLLIKRTCGFEELSDRLFDLLDEDGELVFFPLDKDAEAGVEHYREVWSYLIGGVFSVEINPSSLNHIRNNAAVIVVSSERPDRVQCKKITDSLKVESLWIGPPPEEETELFFTRSLGAIVTDTTCSVSADIYLYSILLALFLDLHGIRNPKRAIHKAPLFTILNRYIIGDFCNDAAVRDQIRYAAERNSLYKSASLVTPNNGTGLSWEIGCDRAGDRSFSFHNFGDGGHGPLSTVDARAAEKFVRIENRENMVTQYGSERVTQWEKQYLSGGPIDRFKGLSASSTASVREGGESPFYSDGYWYLPELRHDYDFGTDNLFLLDGSSNRFVDQALDELSTYGCRYARIITLTQDFFRLSGVKRELYTYPVGQTVFFPAVKNERGETFPIPDMFLPYVHYCTATAFTSAVSGGSGAKMGPAERKRLLFISSFGLLGEAMFRLGLTERYLGRNSIVALKSLSPLITAVEGFGRYRAKKIDDEDDLRRITGFHGPQQVEETIDHFTIVHDQGQPFFMLIPEQDSFDGDALSAVYEYFDETKWDWQEALGTSWQSLAFDTLGIIESRTGMPLVEIPFIEPKTGDGFLYHFYVRYREWDHSQPMLAQVEETLVAMQKGLTAMRQKSPGYIVMVNCFNEELIAHNLVWEDWFIVFVLRSMLLRKTSEELGGLIAQRLKVLFKTLYDEIDQKKATLLKDDIVLEWDKMIVPPETDDQTRWEILFHRLAK